MPYLRSPPDFDIHSTRPFIHRLILLIWQSIGQRISVMQHVPETVTASVRVTNQASFLSHLCAFIIVIDRLPDSTVKPVALQTARTPAARKRDGEVDYRRAICGNEKKKRRMAAFIAELIPLPVVHTAQSCRDIRAIPCREARDWSGSVPRYNIRDSTLEFHPGGREFARSVSAREVQDEE
jgi:hypothetical protein